MSARATRAATDIVNYIQAASDIGETTVEIHKLVDIIDEEMHSAEILKVLNAVYSLTIPGMGWTDKTKEIVKNMVKDIIAKLEG